jgi:SpoVK/Ycf46/Vps4 family AAA+-type ATPase
MIETIKSDYVSEKKTDLIFTIVRDGDEYLIRNLGYGSMPLIKENYTPDVVEDIDFVLKAFLKVPPHGRVCILSGEAGTGKTTIIRSMLSAIDCIFLLVPSSLVDQMDKPELLPLLMNVSQEHKKPLIMIIEDGDVCLVPRENDNISSITSLLNLSDGILGSMLDIKMIISTNASIKDIDKAIMRPGRLCKQIQVNALPYDQALMVFRRISENQEAELEYRKSGYTLAELYSYAVQDADKKVDDGTSTEQSPAHKPSGHYSSSRRSIGFQQPDSAPDLTVNQSDAE